METISIILAAAKSVGVSGSLLLALCAHESAGFTLNYAPMDHGSPSFGSCQIKEKTAAMLGYKGDPNKLNNLKTNAYWAAKYLRFQESRYGAGDWLKIVSSYNAGSYRESLKNKGCPKNMKYVNLVKSRLPNDLKNKLRCSKGNN